MALNKAVKYPDGYLPGIPDVRPYGVAKNATTPTSEDGAPWDLADINDKEGFFQGLLYRAEIVPSLVPDTVLISDYLDSLFKLTGVVYGDISEAVASKFLKKGMLIRTTVNTADISGGGAFYQIKDNAQIIADGDNVDEKGSHTSVGVPGLFLILLPVNGFVTPEMFGAVRDGTTDDFDAINAAVQFGGGLMFLPGTYSIDLSVNIAFMCRNHTRIILDPDTTIAVQAGAADSVSVFRVWSCTNVHISGGTIIGDNATHATATESAHGIYLLQSSHIIIENVKSTNWQGDGIYVGAGSFACVDVTIIRNRCANNSRQGISMTFVDGFVIDDNELTGSGSVNGVSPKAGLDLEPNAGDTVKNGTVSNNWIHDNVDGGMLCNSGPGVVSQVVIESNRFIDNGAVWGGLFVTTSPHITASKNISEGNLSWGIKFQASCTFCEITENHCIGNTENGIETTSIFRTVISENQLISNGENGMLCTATSQCTIDENVSYDNALAGYFCVSQFRNNSMNNNISHENGREGYYFFDRVDGNTINGNIADSNSQETDNTYGGFRFRTTAKENTVIGNKSLTGIGANQQKYGLIIEDADSVDNIWEHNTFEGKTNPIFMSGTIRQSGPTKTFSVGSFAAANDAAFAMFSAGGNVGIYITEAAISNVLEITNDAVNYTKFDIQNRGDDGTGTDTIFISDQWTRDGFAAINIFAYNWSSFDILNDVHIPKDNVISFTKTDAGAGAPIDGAAVELRYIEY